MVMADKIVALRKRNGWSQEELAEILGVSRQSISKWEGSQAVPDMSRIVKMSEVFGVSTDVLLKDDLPIPDGPVPHEVVAESADAIQVSMEEASAYVAEKAALAPRIAAAVAMIVVSPVVLIVCCALAESTARFPLSEAAAAGIGLAVLMVMVAVAVAMLISARSRLERFDRIESGPIDTAYGVAGMARERREGFRPVRGRMVITGVTLCILAVLPLFVGMIFSDSDLYGAVAVAALLVLVASGVYLLTREGIVWGSYEALLEEGSYTRAEKAKSAGIGRIAAAYWLAVVAIVLAYSFSTGSWRDGWVVWPVAGVVFAIVMIVANAVADRRRG